ncbi:MAG: ABC transporter substrate-binding protein [Bacteroidota bacterium]|nr:ABC transporter substrate-binding protein [Bacteroidota bacterium]
MGYAKFVIFVIVIFLSCCKRVPVDKTSTGKGNNNEYSERFIIKHYDGYSKLTVIDPWQGAEKKYYEYYITDDISRIPEGTERTKIIVRPLKSIICTSTTHVAMLNVLGSIELIKGVSGSRFIYNKKLRSRINKGMVSDIGYENAYNTELIYNIGPDIVMVYGIGNELVPAFNRLSDMGITVLYIADYLESHPLARTEWVKVFGELLGKEDMAEKIFRNVSDEYESTVKRIMEESNSKPEVLLGLPFKDKWFISPGNSYISKLIEDAGGRYLWIESQSDVSIPMSLEAVCLKAMSAEIWLNTGSARSISEIRMVDSRLADLPVISEGSVYNNNKRVNEYGGNDYWESGSVNPHLLLKDIASILNPDVFPEHELIYYTELKDKPDSPNDDE